MQQYAVDLAVNDFFNTHKPIRIGEKIHFNRELTDALGNNPPDAIEFELYTYFKEDGYSDRDATALLDRVMLYDYHPSTGFKVMLRPEDEDGVFTFYTRPGDEVYGGTRFRFDAEDNAWLRATQATQDTAWIEKIDQTLRGEGVAGTEVAASRARQEFVDLAMMSPEQQIAQRKNAIADIEDTLFNNHPLWPIVSGVKEEFTAEEERRIERNKEAIAELQQLPSQQYVFMSNTQYRNLYLRELKAARERATHEPEGVMKWARVSKYELEALRVVRKAIERDSQSWTAQQWVRFFNTGKTP